VGALRSLDARAQDRLFSLAIRERDGRCVRCGATYRLECAHIFGRGKPATRHDPENAVALCWTCHDHLDTHPAEKAVFFRSRLGDERYEALQRRSNGVTE